MLTAVYWNVNRLQGFLDEVCFELLLCLSLSLFSNKPRLKSVHLRLQQSDGPHFQKGRPRKKAQTRKKLRLLLQARAQTVVIAEASI